MESTRRFSEKWRIQCIKVAYWRYCGSHYQSKHNINPAKKNRHRKGNKDRSWNIILSRIRENMSKDLIRANDILHQTGCNNWSNIIPIVEFNYNLKKQQFLEKVQLRYQQSISLWQKNWCARWESLWLFITLT